jgi:hypothetical protein
MTTNDIITSAATAAGPSTSGAAPADGSFAFDEAFFRMTASLFAPPFLYGAGVLLGSYDDEVDDLAVTLSSTVGHDARHSPQAATSSQA